jgi:hypothetical protein
VYFMTIQQIIYSMANSAMPNEENAKLAVVFICDSRRLGCVPKSFV